MTVTLQRDRESEAGVFGELLIDGAHEAWTLENDELEIPSGSYGLVIRWSPHFKRMVPWLVNVPGREAIEIHPGTYETDSRGCILLGENRTQEEVLHSRAACEAFQSKLAAVLARGETVQIEIKDAVAGDG